MTMPTQAKVSVRPATSKGLRVMLSSSRPKSVLYWLHPLLANLASEAPSSSARSFASGARAAAAEAEDASATSAATRAALDLSPLPGLEPALLSSPSTPDSLFSCGGRVGAV
jgi:hypothetical protein